MYFTSILPTAFGRGLHVSRVYA